MPPDLDHQIEAAARQDGVPYSAWLALTARKELAIRAGLAAVASVEAEIGAFTDQEMAQARAWARDAHARQSRSGTRHRPAA